jgi:hypothetical protein
MMAVANWTCVWKATDLAEYTRLLARLQAMPWPLDVSITIIEQKTKLQITVIYSPITETVP